MELNGIEPFSAMLMADARLNELLRVHQWYVVYHKKLTLSNLFRKKINFSPKFDILSFFQRENRACNSATESAHLVPLVRKAIVSLLKTANPDGDERI